jgi:NADPH-dependent F420 reductase
MNERMILSIGLISGTGNLGPGLARRWAMAGYRVIIGSRSLEKAQRVADELNAELEMESIVGMENADAARSADICVLTVKSTAHAASVEGIKHEVKDKIVIDATSRVDFRDPKPPSSPSAPEIAREMIGDGARVVAAFQTIPAHALNENPHTSLDLDVLIAADDEADMEEVAKLVAAAGLNPYFVGGLEKAIVLEGMTALAISMNKHYQSREGTFRVEGIQN